MECTCLLNIYHELLTNYVGVGSIFFLRLKNERKKKPAGPDFSTTISRRIELSYHLLSIEENVCDLIIIFAIIPKNSWKKQSDTKTLKLQSNSCFLQNYSVIFK